LILLNINYLNSLALLSSGTLRIGTIDSIQKLHIRTVNLNETTRRISYQTETQTFGIITYRMDYENTEGVLKPVFPTASSQCPNQYFSKPGILLQQNQNESVFSSVPTSSKYSSNESNKNELIANGSFDPILVHSFLILDQNTFEVMHSIQFHPSEYLVACLSISFDSEPNVPYYVIGCCETKEDEPEPKSGRIIVLKYFENKLIQVCEKEFKGAPYCLQNFNGKILASVSNSLKLIDFKDNQLTQICSYSDSVFITHLKCKNDFILLGDLTKSCTVLTYRADNNCFEQVAKDFTPVWLSCIEMIDDDNFLLCDSFQNVIILKKDRFINQLFLNNIFKLNIFI
jgi:DNA damage-binding protein 1